MRQKIACVCGKKTLSANEDLIECKNCGTVQHSACHNTKLVGRILPFCYVCQLSPRYRCVCEKQVESAESTFHMAIQCSTCNFWLHCSCVGIHSSEEIPEHYQCTLCKKMLKEEHAKLVKQQMMSHNSKQNHSRQRTSTRLRIKRMKRRDHEVEVKQINTSKETTCGTLNKKRKSKAKKAIAASRKAPIPREQDKSAKVPCKESEDKKCSRKKKKTGTKVPSKSFKTGFK